MEPRLTIITLGVANLETATKFYTETLGWKTTKATNESITFIQLNGILLSIYPREKLAEDAGVSIDEKGFNKFSLAYVTRTKEEVDTIMTKLKEKDVNIVKEAKEAFWGGYSGYFSDPDGNLWEVAFNPYLELDAEGNVVS